MTRGLTGKSKAPRFDRTAIRASDGGMKHALFIVGMLLGTSLAPVAASASDGCTCRFSGGEVYEGETACIRTTGGATLARCEKFLNNTSWKMLNQPCPTASLAVPEGSQADPAVLAAIHG